jgi:hypothetical protein
MQAIESMQPSTSLPVATPSASASIDSCVKQPNNLSSAAHVCLGPLPPLQVGELSASNLRLSSGGGSIAVQRLFALDAQLVSQGGAVGIGALYGVKVALDSGRGRLAVGHMSCSGLAMLQSGGAGLAVDGLEGNASLISSGGDIKVGRCLCGVGWRARESAGCVC